MKATHTTIYTADDGTEYTDARLCAAHEAILADGKHDYGTMGFETARDALAATLQAPIVLDRGSLMRALAVTLRAVADALGPKAGGEFLRELGLRASPEGVDGEIGFAVGVATLCCEEGWK